MKIVLVLVIVGLSIWIAYEKFFKTGKSVGLECNSPVMKCACFFRGDRCPDTYELKSAESKMCPPDGSNCNSEENYRTFLKAERDKGDDGRFGTCCQAPSSKVSPSRFKGYEAAPAGPSVQPITAPGASAATDAHGVETLQARGITVDCTDIDDCNDYNTDFVCYHDPCGIGRCVSYFSGCDKNRFSSCNDCPSSCTMSDYCTGSDFDALRSKNPCQCSS